MSRLLNLYNYTLSQAKWICKDEDLAADLTQQVYLKVLKNGLDENGFENDGYLKGYLKLAVRNEFINHIRKYTPIESVLVDVEEVKDLVPGLPETDNYIPDYLKNALDNLKDELRLLFIIIVLYDYSYEECSKIFNIPARTVKNRVFRAKKSLKEQLSCV